jgi:type II secretory ATPase GspE/PulE/Tfp pilus assembly ATPase PilB-like protein/DNA-binding NarL/FixJ family response regulator
MAKHYGSLFLKSTDQNGEQVPESEPYRLLIVDDDPGVLAALRRVFLRENYDLHFARNAAEGLKILEGKPIQLVISDFMMPGMTGSEFLSVVRERWPETIRIMLTGQANTQAVMGSIKDGAVYRFILKPWSDDDLRVTIALALEQYALMIKNRALEQQNQKQQHDIETLAKLSSSNRRQLAIMLHKKGLLNAQQIQQLQREVQANKTPVIVQLMQHDWVSAQKVFDVLRQDMLFEEVDLLDLQPELSVLSLVPKSICTRQVVLPLRVLGKKLRLAMADPMDAGLIDELAFLTGYAIQPLLCGYEQLRKKLIEIYGEQENQNFGELNTVVDSADPYESIEVVIDDGDSPESLEQLLGSSEEPPAIRLVNAIILEALRLRASDIHIHPRTKYVAVRYRIDGVLQDKIQIPTALLMSLVSRIKVMSELDITERRRPQDGRITIKTPMRIVDLRISTLPTINGEKVVMRVLDRQSAAQSLEDLGFSPNNLRRILHVVNKPQGMILATGPTGSGKSTTLFAMLQHDATPNKNYVTIEDPVEFHVDMAGQVPVRERIGMNFATILRSILRQDPDVILLGEIRDHETAEVAFHAALTGHTVFSTLHTNSAAATIARLLDLGLKPYVLATGLEAIIAQRLMRKICPHCKEEVQPDAALLRSLGPGFLEPGLKFYRGHGCEKCSQGYKGRVGIHEVLTMSDALREAILQGAGMVQVQMIARQQGMVSVLDDAREKVLAGLTTVDEVLRTLGPQVIEGDA